MSHLYKKTPNKKSPKWNDIRKRIYEGKITFEKAKIPETIFVFIFRKVLTRNFEDFIKTLESAPPQTFIGRLLETASEMVDDRALGGGAIDGAIDEEALFQADLQKLVESMKAQVRQSAAPSINERAPETSEKVSTSSSVATVADDDRSVDFVL